MRVYTLMYAKKRIQSKVLVIELFGYIIKIHYNIARRWE